MKLGGIYIGVKAKTDRLKKDLADAKTMTKKAAVYMQHAVDSISFKKVALAATAFGAAGIYAFQKIAREAVRFANEQEAVEKRLAAVIKATGQAAGFNIKQMGKMASSYQKLTIVGDEVILSGQAILATFKTIRGEGFERATMAALDMAEVMQQDLKGAMVMIGKSMNDPIANLSAMTRSGVQFTKSQKDMIKSLWKAGDVMEAQNIILTELESQFGGAAKAARETFGGAAKAAGNALGDLKEELGFAITKSEFFIDIAKDAEKTFIKWTEIIKEHRGELEKLAINLYEIVKITGKWAKKLTEISLIVSGIKPGIWFVEWLDGTHAVRKETEEWREQLKRLQEALEASGKTAAEVYTEAWVKAYEEKVRAWGVMARTEAEAEAEMEAFHQELEDFWERAENYEGLIDSLEDIKAATKEAENSMEAFHQELEDFWWRAEKYERLIIPPPEKVKKELTNIQKEYDVFFERVQGAWADTFYDIYKNQWEGWENLLGKMTDLFARTLSEWVAEAAKTKIKTYITTETTGGAGGAGGTGAGAVGYTGYGGMFMAGFGLFLANVMIKAHKDAEKKARLTWQAGLGWEENILGERMIASFDIFSKRCDELANLVSGKVQELLGEYGTTIERLVKSTIAITGINLGKLVKSLEAGSTAHAKSRGLSHITSRWLENFEKGIEGYFKRFLDYTLLPSWELWIEGTFRDETVLADIERFGDAFHEAFDVAGPKGVLELWDMVAGLMEDIERAIHPEHFEGLIFQLKELNKIYAEQRELAEAIGVSTQLVGEAHRVSVLDLIKEREEGIFTLADFSDRLSDLQDLSVGYSALLGDITESAEDLRAVGVEWWAAWEAMIRPELYDPGYISGIEAYHGSLEAWRQFLFDFYQIEPPPEYLGPATFTDEQWARFNELLGEIPERFIDWFDEWFDPNIMLSSWVDPMQTVLATLEGNITNWGMSLADISLLIETLFGDLETILAETQLEPAVQQLKQELDTIDDLIVGLFLPTLGEDLQQLFTDLDIDLPAEFSQQNITNTLNAIQAYRDQLVGGIFAPIQEIIDRHILTDYELGLKALNEWYDENVLVLNTLGLALDDLNYAYDLQLGALQELKKELSSPWDDVIKSIQDQILSLTTSMASPLTTIERMALVAAEIAATGIPTTPEEVGSFQSLYGQYLDLAQEAYQRPSTEYKAIFDQTISDLNYLSTIAEGLKTEYDIQVEQLQVLYNIYGTLQGIGSGQHGIDYVPHTGLYHLHQGERVTPAGKDYPELQINLTVNVNGGNSPGATGRAVREEIEDFFDGSIGRKMIQQIAAGR